MRLHLLDGTYELFRSFYGRKDTRLAPDGRNVNATFGALVSTLALLDQPDVTHLAVATDTVIESFRNDLFAGYKTSSGVPVDLLDQFPLAEECWEAMGVVVWRMRDYEADDAIATAAARWGGQVDQCLILTPDKDLAQSVIGDRVVMVDRMRAKLIDEPAVVAKFGVGPGSIPDFLALVGDAADGIPGLPGWGAKSAAAVLSRYGTIEAIPLDWSVWDVTVRSAPALAATLAENQELVMLYKDLTTLRLDVPLAEGLDDLAWLGPDPDRFRRLCIELGFESLLDRFGLAD